MAHMLYVVSLVFQTGYKEAFSLDQTSNFGFDSVFFRCQGISGRIRLSKNVCFAWLLEHIVF